MGLRSIYLARRNGIFLFEAKKKEKIKETRINILASGGAAFPDLRIAACTRQRGHGGRQPAAAAAVRRRCGGQRR